MKTILKIVGFLLLVVSFSACDVIDNPIKEGGSRPPIDTNLVVRKVLIEDFTGHQCKNCPNAAEEIHKLQGIYGDNVIGIAIHAGPSNFTGTNADYPTDYRTPEGNQIGVFFYGSISGISLPSGMVSRINYPTSHIKSYTSWPAIATGLLDSIPHIKLKATLAYNAADSSATVDVEATALKDFTDDLKFVVMITESDIVSPQLMPDGSRNVNYVHQHVLRKAFTQALGDDLALSPITATSVLTKQITGTVSSAWVAANCDIVVYVYNERTKEVLQAEQVHLIP